MAKGTLIPTVSPDKRCPGKSAESNPFRGRPSDFHRRGVPFASSGGKGHLPRGAISGCPSPPGAPCRQNTPADRRRSPRVGHRGTGAIQHLPRASGDWQRPEALAESGRPGGRIGGEDMHQVPTVWPLFRTVVAGFQPAIGASGLPGCNPNAQLFAVPTTTWCPSLPGALHCLTELEATGLISSR